MDNTYTPPTVTEELSQDAEGGNTYGDASPLPPIIVPTEDASASSAEASPPAEHTDGKRGEKLKLILMLFGTVLATIAVIVYGYKISLISKKLPSPLSEHFLSEVFSAGIASIGGTYARVPLTRIPPQTVNDGDVPGASEHLTLPEDSAAPPTAGIFPVRDVDLAVTYDNVFAMINETPYTPDTLTIYANELTIPTLDKLHVKYGAASPTVLILHTHGTESYLDEGDAVYTADESFRSYDTDENVIAVGRAAAAVFRENGIGVIHLETMFDEKDYNSAYYLAAEEIKKICAAYPSIAYVFDIHRDAMITSDGVCLAPVSPLETDEGDAAQLMLVVGTDHAGSGHSKWEENLSLALKIQRSALAINGGIMRPLNLRSASFNEQYTSGSLLVEVGAAGNSLSEAVRAVKIFATAASEVIKSGR
ncbi:MAG: stage II sporulation protein P [Clostridia bacterium]|nr:stage II sporulation protein P [Clostridia bacterium]